MHEQSIEDRIISSMTPEVDKKGRTVMNFVLPKEAETRYVTVYVRRKYGTLYMIRSFKDKKTEQFFGGAAVKEYSSFGKLLNGS